MCARIVYNKNVKNNKNTEHQKGEYTMQELMSMNTSITNSGCVNYGLIENFISYMKGRSKKTIETYIINLRQFAAWMNYEAITQPIRENIDSYMEYLSSEHDAIQYDAVCGWRYRTDSNGHRLTVICKPATVSLYLRSVKQFFKWTALEGFYPNIADGIRAVKINREQYKKDYLKPADVRAIEDSITNQIGQAAGQMDRTTEQGKRLYAMFVLAVNAGLRTIELERAKVNNITVNGGQAYIYIWGKGHLEPDQKKPLPPEVYEAIQDYLHSRQDRYNGNSPLFVATGNRSGGQKIAARTISQMLKRAMRQAGYDSERLTAHSLRHTAGVAAMGISRDLYTTQRYMRHSNPATTEIYLHENEETEAQDIAMAKKVYARFHGTEEQDNRSRLESLLDGMSMEQIEQMANIATAMTRH